MKEIKGKKIGKKCDRERERAGDRDEGKEKERKKSKERERGGMIEIQQGRTGKRTKKMESKDWRMEEKGPNTHDNHA